MDKWITGNYVVHMSDGTTISVYAPNEESALESVRRYLSRGLESRTAVRAEKWEPTEK